MNKFEWEAEMQEVRFHQTEVSVEARPGYKRPCYHSHPAPVSRTGNAAARPVLPFNYLENYLLEQIAWCPADPSVIAVALSQQYYNHYAAQN